MHLQRSQVQLNASLMIIAKVKHYQTRNITNKAPNLKKKITSMMTTLKLVKTLLMLKVHSISMWIYRIIRICHAKTQHLKNGINVFSTKQEDFSCSFLKQQYDEMQ